MLTEVPFGVTPFGLVTTGSEAALPESSSNHIRCLVDIIHFHP